MLALIVVFYLVLMVAIGFFLSRRVKLASDFLVAGGKLGFLLTTATLAAVQIGSGVIFGGSELAAESGIWPGMWYGIGCGGGLIFAGLLVASKLKKHGGIVPLDFFGSRYGERKWVRVWGWLSNIPSLLGIFVAQIMAAGSVFSLFGFTYAQGVVLTGLAIMLYSVASGMWGVVVIDFIQLAIIIVGIPLVAVITWHNFEGAGTMQAQQVFATSFLPTGMFSKAVFIIIPFLLSISVSYDAFMRFQSAKSAKVAKWSSIFAGIIVILISFCIGLTGALGRIMYPEVESNIMYPHIIRSSLSPVLTGLVVSALLAAIMSSANCLLISLSGCFTRDLYNKVLHTSSDLDRLKHSKLISRLTIVGALIAGILIAFKAKGILYTIIIFNYPYMGSMLVPLLGGVLWKRATAKGAVAAIFTGGTIGVVSFFAGFPGKLQELFNVDLGLLIAYSVSALVFVSVSLYTGSSGSTETLLRSKIH